MDFSIRESYVNRIMAGLIKIQPGIFIAGTSPDTKMAADEIYDDAFDAAYSAGNLLDDELEILLFEKRIWTDAQESELRGCEKDLENMKVGVLSKQLQYKELEVTKKAIAKVKDKIHELLNRRHSLDFLSCRGFANIERSKFLIASSIVDSQGRPMCQNFWEADSEFLNSVMHTYLDTKLTETQIREIARTEPWRSIWAIGKERDIFGKPITYYNEEQRALCLWSTFYDNIYSHPERPGDNIIEDDDFLDGWLISQNKKNKAAETEKKSGVGNKKGDVFIPVDSMQAAEEISNMNNPVAASIKKKRLDHIKNKGRTNEAHLPDVKKDLQMKWNELQMRGKQ